VIVPFGERALLVELRATGAPLALFESLEADPIAGIVEVVPGRSSVLVELDDAADMVAVSASLAARAGGAPPTRRAGRLRTIPVTYGDEYGPDLADVARLTGLTESEVVAAHLATELSVLFCGFAAGFAYLGDLPRPLHVDRLATPRTRTPAGAVALAGPMSGIYPAELPGGWRVIGRTPLRLFDPTRRPPAYLVPGDRVRWERITADEWVARAEDAPDW
jgi:KipI family sensor histidine kinase inhibitor